MYVSFTPVLFQNTHHVPDVPLKEGQGCIAGPRFGDNWVGIYWLLPTIFYTVSLVLALNRSFKSLHQKHLSPWKLMLRDGLNLYGAIWLVNMVNMLFWFIAKPTDNADTIKTIVTSMTAVLTTTMTLRIILSIRGPLASGGSFNGGSTVGTSSHSNGASGTGRSGGPGPHVLSVPTHSHTTRSQGTNGVIAITPGSGARIGAPMFTIGKEERSEWVDDGKSSVVEEGKEGLGYESGSFGEESVERGNGARGGYGMGGVKVTIDKHVDDGFGRN